MRLHRTQFPSVFYSFILDHLKHLNYFGVLITIQTLYFFKNTFLMHTFGLNFLLLFWWFESFERWCSGTLSHFWLLEIFFSGLLYYAKNMPMNTVTTVLSVILAILQIRFKNFSWLLANNIYRSILVTYCILMYMCVKL